MARDITVWYDREADYLEVVFERKEGYFRATPNDAVMEKVDAEGNVIGFSVLNARQGRGDAPVSFTLNDRSGE